MVKQFKRKLATKIAAQTILAGFCVALVMGGLGFIYNLQQLKLRYDTSITDQVNTILPSINMALFSFDENYLKKIVTGLIAHPAISSVTIADIDEVPQAHASLKQECVDASKHTILSPPSQFYLFELSYADTQLGKLIITPDACNFLTDARDIIGQILVFSLVFSAIISIFIFILFHRQVTSPLNHLVSFIASIDEKSLLEVDLKVLQSDRSDELGTATYTAAATFK